MDYNLGEKEVSEMEQILKKMGWASIVTSIAFAIIGLIMVYNPTAIPNIDRVISNWRKEASNI